MITFGNGILLIQNGIHGTGNRLAIGDVHAAILINIQPQETLRAFPDIFHIPQCTAMLDDDRLGKLGNDLGNFHKRASLSKKREGS